MPLGSNDNIRYIFLLKLAIFFSWWGLSRIARHHPCHYHPEHPEELDASDQRRSSTLFWKQKPREFCSHAPAGECIGTWTTLGLSDGTLF